MKNCTYILDAGHGGMIKGKYQTRGKRSPKWEDGRQIFEGVLNREIVSIIANMLEEKNITFHILVPEEKDISLRERVNRAHNLKTDNDKVFISVHSNSGGGTGFEVFTSHGTSKSDRLATLLWLEIAKNFPDIRMRSCMVDGDVDKESSFYVLRKTRMPAILGENFFMDTLKPDFEIIWSEEGKINIAKSYVGAILNYHKENSYKP